MTKLTLFAQDGGKMLNLREASKWVYKYLNQRVTISNILYLIQYGRVKNYGNNESPLINKDELKEYYDSIKKNGKKF